MLLTLVLLFVVNLDIGVFADVVAARASVEILLMDLESVLLGLHRRKCDPSQLPVLITKIRLWDDCVGAFRALCVVCIGVAAATQFTSFVDVGTARMQHTVDLDQTSALILEFAMLFAKGPLLEPRRGIATRKRCATMVMRSTDPTAK